MTDTKEKTWWEQHQEQMEDPVTKVFIKVEKEGLGSLNVQEMTIYMTERHQQIHKYSLVKD